MELQPYQQRVVSERKELDEKVGKLKKFILGPSFEQVSKDEQGRLRHQYTLMLGYLLVLTERIENFNKTEQQACEEAARKGFNS